MKKTVPNQVMIGRGRGLRVAAIELGVVAALAMTPALAGQAEDAEAEASAEVSAEAVVEAGPVVGEPMACSEFSQQRYPFLSCVRGPSGGPVLATEGPGVPAARLQLKSEFADGAGGWGASGIE